MGQTILIVDDNKFIVEGLHAILRRRGYQTVSALGGAEALQVLSTSVPDLVLLDITMEPIDGWETLRRMRSERGLESVPVIIFSARRTLSEEAACHQYNVSDVLAKPINTSRLLEVIEKVLNPGEGGTGAGAGCGSAAPGTGEEKPAPEEGESPPVAADVGAGPSLSEASEGEILAGSETGQGAGAGEVAAFACEGEEKPAPAGGESMPVTAVAGAEPPLPETGKGEVLATSRTEHGIEGGGEEIPGGTEPVPAGGAEKPEPVTQGEGAVPLAEGEEKTGGEFEEKPGTEQEIHGEDAKRKSLESRMREYHVSIGFEGHLPDQ